MAGLPWWKFFPPPCKGSFFSSLNGKNLDGSIRPYHLGHWFIAIQVAAFTDPKEFKKTAGDILRELRASRKAAGQNRIYTAGEKEYLAYLERSKTGIPLNPVVRKSLETARNKQKPNSRFPWQP